MTTSKDDFSPFSSSSSSSYAPWLEKWVKTGGQDDGDEDESGLCCCQFINEKGERSHLCALLCDCEAVDEVADRILSGRPVTYGAAERVWRTLEDRCRLPWPGGARKVAPEVAAAPAAVAAMLWLSSFGDVAFAVTHVTVGILLFLFQRKILRLRPQTKFFYCWSVSTSAALFLEYEVGVVGVAFALPKTVSFWENLCLVSAAAAAAASLAWAKGRARRDLVWSPAEREAKKAKYCKVCGSYVFGKDHHCVWLDTCVSASSRGPFLLCLTCLAATLFHLAAILLSSACRRSELYLNDLLLLPSDCSGYNPKFEGDPGMAMACGAHAALLFFLVALALGHTAVAGFLRNVRVVRAVRRP